MLDEIITKHSIKNDRKIKQICLPLIQYLEIEFFTYYFIEEDGHFGILSNAFDFMELYYFQKLYLNNPYMSHPNLFRSGHVYAPCTYDDEIQCILKDQFKADHLFLSLECNPGQMEGFIFANKNSGADTLSDYLEKLDLLNKFSRYFKREAQSIIGRMSSEKYNISQARENEFLHLPENLPLSKNKHLEQQFLAEIWKLSPQEQKCLEMFKLGNSAQSTAAKLGLSQRTVEHYLDNVKIKLGCSSKWDLLNT